MGKQTEHTSVDTPLHPSSTITLGCSHFRRRRWLRYGSMLGQSYAITYNEERLLINWWHSRVVRTINIIRSSHDNAYGSIYRRHTFIRTSVIRHSSQFYHITYV